MTLYAYITRNYTTFQDFIRMGLVSSSLVSAYECYTIYLELKEEDGSIQKTQAAEEISNKMNGKYKINSIRLKLFLMERDCKYPVKYFRKGKTSRI